MRKAFLSTPISLQKWAKAILLPLPPPPFFNGAASPSHGLAYTVVQWPYFSHCARWSASLSHKKSLAYFRPPPSLPPNQSEDYVLVYCPPRRYIAQSLAIYPVCPIQPKPKIRERIETATWFLSVFSSLRFFCGGDGRGLVKRERETIWRKSSPIKTFPSPSPLSLLPFPPSQTNSRGRR